GDSMAPPPAIPVPEATPVLDDWELASLKGKEAALNQIVAQLKARSLERHHRPDGEEPVATSESELKEAVALSPDYADLKRVAHVRPGGRRFKNPASASPNPRRDVVLY